MLKSKIKEMNCKVGYCLTYIILSAALASQCVPIPARNHFKDFWDKGYTHSTKCFISISNILSLMDIDFLYIETHYDSYKHNDLKYIKHIPCLSHFAA